VFQLGYQSAPPRGRRSTGRGSKAACPTAPKPEFGPGPIASQGEARSARRAPIG
jgi:hypothetical protein